MSNSSKALVKGKTATVTSAVSTALSAVHVAAAKRVSEFQTLIATKSRGKTAAIVGVLFLFALGLMFLPLLAAKASTAILYMFGFDGKVSGRMDGNVLMGNGRGRAFVKPSLVRNAYTLNARGIFSSFSSAYKGLTQLQIAAWSQTQMSVSNRLGQAKTISGKQVFLRLNANLAYSGNGGITDPPVFSGVTPMPNWSINTLSATSVKLDSDAAVVPTNMTVLVFATKQLDLGISKPSSSAYRLLGLIATGITVNTQDFIAEYSIKFGTPVTGNKVFFLIKVINNTTGESSITGAASGIVV